MQSDMGLGEFFALASAVVWAVAVIMFTRIGDRLPAFDFNLVKSAICLVLLLLTAFLFESVSIPSLSISDWVILSTSGLIGVALADTLYMKSLNLIGAGSTGVVAALYSPFVVILSVFYLNETFSFVQIGGLLFVLAGILFISLEKPFKPIPKRQKVLGFICGASSVFFTALGVVMIKPVIESQPFFWSSAIRLFIGLIGMMIYLTILKQWSPLVTRLREPHNWTAITISSVLGAYVASSLWLAGFKYADASVAAILNETTSIFIVLLAWLILKEPLSLNKVIGTCLAIVGVVMVIFM